MKQILEIQNRSRLNINNYYYNIDIMFISNYIIYKKYLYIVVKITFVYSMFYIYII